MSSGASAASVFTRQPVPGSVLSGHLSHLPLSCQLRLKDMVQTDALGPADLDPKLIIDLCNMPEESALVCVERFLNSNLFQIRNKSGFMVGVISRFKQEAGARGPRHRGDGPKANVAGHGDPAKTIYVGKLGGCVALSGWLNMKADFAEGKEFPTEASKATPCLWGHGAMDDKVLFPHQKIGVDLLTARGVTVDASNYPMGHSAHPEELAKLAAFLAGILFP